MSFTDNESNNFKLAYILPYFAGAALTSYLGLSLFIPLVAGILFSIILNKLKYPSTDLIYFSAAQSAQIGWFTVAVIIMPDAISLVGMDIIIGLILLVAAMFFVHWIPIILTICFQLFGIFLNSQTILTNPLSPENFKALIVHTLLRILIISLGSYFVYTKYLSKGKIHEI